MVVPFTAEQLVTIENWQTALSTLSFLGSLFIVVSFFTLKSLREKFAFKLVAFLSIADAFGTGVGNFFYNPVDGTAVCYIQASLIAYFQLAAVLWTSVITFCLYQTALRGVSPAVIEAQEWKFHLYAWVH
jgi:hypothetical protein